MDKRKMEADLKLTLYVLAAKAELDNNIIGLGDVELALRLIWDAYELVDGRLKKLLKQAYDSLNEGNVQKARQLLEYVIERFSGPRPELEEF